LSAACAIAGPVQIASESARLAGMRCLKLIRIPDVLLVSPDRTHCSLDYLVGQQ
jgi:hypothetical protein